MYFKARELHDEMMERQTLARLRDYLAKLRSAYDEILNGAKYSYELFARLPSDQQSFMLPLKRIFLSALIRHSADISFSKHAEELEAMLLQDPRLMNDYLRALSI